MEQKRKRGRPRKIVKLEPPKRDPSETREKKEENIVLFLALSDTENSSENNNGFTINVIELLEGSIKECLKESLQGDITF